MPTGWPVTIGPGHQADANQVTPMKRFDLRFGVGAPDFFVD